MIFRTPSQPSAAPKPAAPSGIETLIVKHLAPMVETWAQKAGIDMPQAIAEIMKVVDRARIIDERTKTIEEQNRRLLVAIEAIRRDTAIMAQLGALPIPANRAGHSSNGYEAGHADIDGAGVDV